VALGQHSITHRCRLTAISPWRAGCTPRIAGIATIDNASHQSILTASISSHERRAPAAEPLRLCAFHERTSMSHSNAQSSEQRIAGIVQRVLAEHSINRVIGSDEDLRKAGLSSLDMVSLVLSVEEEFGLMVPEASIMPANFGSIAAISRLVESLQKNS
jgi:acyl carrier protein